MSDDTASGRDDAASDDAAALPTRLIHHGYRAPASFDAVPVGVYKASTVLFRDVAALRARDWKSRAGYTYGLHGTPTTFTLEQRIATLEGGTHTLLAPSGLAAIVMVNVALLRAGDEVALPHNVYGPSRALAANELAAWGIGHRMYDPMDLASLETAITPQTRLVWIEAPGSVTMEFPDLQALLRITRQRGVTSAIDHTWGAGIAYRAFDVGGGADVAMQALTKYASGGADVLMGSVTTRDEALYLRLSAAHMRLGLGIGANDAEAVLRSLPSLALRYREHDRSARQVAQWLASRPEVDRVLHPALAGSPGHEHWSATCGAAAGLFSIVLAPRYPPARVDAFVDALRLFGIGYSWGGPVSLAVPYDLSSMRGGAAPYRGSLVRFSIGLESSDDLIRDLQQALAALAG